MSPLKRSSVPVRVRAALLIVGATILAWGRPGVQARASGPKRAANVADRSAKGLIGRWVIDLRRMAPSPVYATPDGRKATREAYLEFLPGGRYIDGLVGLPGRYEVSGSKVKLIEDLTHGQVPLGSVKVEPDFGEYDAKAGTLTFSQGPRRVVYVHAPKQRVRPRG